MHGGVLAMEQRSLRSPSLWQWSERRENRLDNDGEANTACVSTEASEGVGGRVGTRSCFKKSTAGTTVNVNEGATDTDESVVLGEDVHLSA